MRTTGRCHCALRYHRGLANAGTGRCLAAALLGLAVAACAPTVSRPQTDIMEKTGKIGVSAAVLRARVNDLIDRSVGSIEQTADRIIADTQDDIVRRRALLLKVDAISAVYTAGFRADPLAAAVDVWGFAFQFSDYMETGAGRAVFGPQQALVLACARDMLAAADAVMKTIAIRPEHFDQGRLRVERWAKANVVEYGFSSRASNAALMADLRSDNQDVFVTVGAVSDLIADLSERLNTYAAQLPRQARWEAEILVSEFAGANGVESALGDLHEVSTSVARAADVLGDVPGVLDAQRKSVLAEFTAERQAVLAGVDTQRARTLEYLTRERLSILDAARDERLALIEAMRRERLEIVREVDAITTRAVVSSLAGFRSLIDYTLWRVAALTTGLLLATAVVAVIASRLASGRRRQAMPS